ncbi:MAG TPA: pitrilysin family protein [Steroidobacteraceae bacterium]|nr:pitrilysin family protein [Steroidobacteraceae bacterium]
MPTASLGRTLSLGLLAFATLAAAAPPRNTVPPEYVVHGEDQVKSLTLANGMKVIVWTDRDIPNVALYNWVRVGSRNEVPGITGLAHFFEHMMFNGTSKRKPGEFDRAMEAQGGSNNAFTTDDVTVYQDWVPRAALDLAFDLESDRLANLSFDPKVIESERGVVYSERRLRTEDSNEGFLAEQVQGTAFIAHPYQNPTVGWPADIQGWTVEDLQKFFKTNYAPNNCTLILVGDVGAEEVFALAKKYLEPIPRQEPPPKVRTTEPEQLGERRVRVQRDASTPLLYAAYKSPAANDPQGPAINLLFSILTEGNSSRLHRQLVEEKKLAIDVAGRFQEGFDPGLSWLMLTLPEGARVPAVEAALDQALAQVVQQGVTDAELARAKNLFLSGFWKGLATVNGKASALGAFEVFEGDYRKLFSAPETYRKVTREDVQKAAALIFQKAHRTVGVLEAPPQAAAPAAPAAEAKP